MLKLLEQKKQQQQYVSLMLTPVNVEIIGDRKKNENEKQKKKTATTGL